MSLFEVDDVVPLITHNGSTYSVDHDTMTFLSTVCTPIAIVSVAGRFRTGKSLLLNTLCDGDGAFTVGETVNACTKGIRLRKTPLHASETLTVFLIDTEGIGSLDADSQHDCNILALALLLSSSFLYNSVGSIDDAALQSLGLMTRVSEFIRVDADQQASEADLAAFFPRFYWVLRDFSLRLESAQGEKCSEAEYLETALADADGHDDRNRVRSSLRTAFPHRSLVTLPRPAQDTQRMSRRNMSSAFLAGVKGLRVRILNEIEPLRAAGADGGVGQAVTGPMLAQICSYYTSTLNKPGAVPCIRDSWSMLVEIQARDAAAAVRKEASETMRTLAATYVNPTQLRQLLDDQVTRSMVEFSKRLMQPDAARAEEIKAELTEEAGRHVTACQIVFDRKVEESMHLLEASANREDAHLGEIASLVSQAMRQLEIDLNDDPHGLARWRAKCLENLVNVWIPRLLHTYDNEKELNTFATAELKSRCEEAERLLEDAKNTTTRETERVRRDADLQLEAKTSALQMQLDAQNAYLKDERERNDGLEQELATVRLEFAQLRARTAETPPGEDGENTDGSRIMASDDDDLISSGDGGDDEQQHVSDRRRIMELEATVRDTSDEVRELRICRDTLQMQCSKEKAEREKIELVCQQRLQTIQAKQTEVIEKLRLDHDESVRKARDEASAATQKQTELRREVSTALQQAARAEAMKEDGEQSRMRELRMSAEAQLTLRAMCEDLQIRMVEMQKVSLHDVRVSEQRHREKLGTAATEQLQSQIQCGEAMRREQQVRNEVNDLKRRLASAEEVQRDSKRLKESLQEHQARSEQLTSENDRIRIRLEEAVAERERLRTAHIKAESERSALNRELQLVRAENAV